MHNLIPFPSNRVTPRQTQHQPATVTRLHSSAHAARELYRRATALDSSNPALAARLYREAADTAPDGMPEALSNLGNCHWALGDTRTAIGLWTEAITQNPGLAQAHYNLGYARATAGEHARAVLCYQRALNIDPGFADAWFNIALSHEANRDYGAAVEALEYYLMTSPPSGACREQARSSIARLNGRFAG